MMGYCCICRRAENAHISMNAQTDLVYTYGIRVFFPCCASYVFDGIIICSKDNVKIIIVFTCAVNR